MIQIKKTLEAFAGSSSTQPESRPSSSEAVQTGDGKLKHFLDSSKEELLEDERRFLQEALAFLEVRIFPLSLANIETAQEPPMMLSHQHASAKYMLEHCQVL